ncbi:hypothetical protein WR25_08127 [Diploscapter pachys]|uniref:Cyclin-dependent kinase inhibitor domain-containing protein n=1 Tax=Diploscapter pachys TaxID=2018661 RepID=A0A2A2JKN6_9BILA|nr:hypothetical protein WR25_08127 [Diploscapter pachys]
MASAAEEARAKWNFDFVAEHPVINGEGDFVFVAANIDEVPAAYHPRVRRTKARSRTSPEMSDEEDQTAGRSRMDGDGAGEADDEDKPTTSSGRGSTSAGHKTQRISFKDPNDALLSNYTPPMTRSHYRQLVSKGSLQSAVLPPVPATPGKKSVPHIPHTRHSDSVGKPTTSQPSNATNKGSKTEKSLVTPKKTDVDADNENSTADAPSAVSSRILKQASLTNYLHVRKRRPTGEAPLPTKITKKKDSNTVGDVSSKSSGKAAGKEKSKENALAAGRDKGGKKTSARCRRNSTSSSSGVNGCGSSGGGAEEAEGDSSGVGVATRSSRRLAAAAH